MGADASDRTPPPVEVSLDADPVIEAYERDIDVTLLRENRRKSVEERILSLMALRRLAGEARRARRASRDAQGVRSPSWSA